MCPHPALVLDKAYLIRFSSHSMPFSSELSLQPSVTGVGEILFAVKYDMTFHPPTYVLFCGVG